MAAGKFLLLLYAFFPFPDFRRRMCTEPVRVPLKPMLVAQKPLGFCVPEGCFGAVFCPLEKAYMSPYRQLTGHLTGSLTAAYRSRSSEHKSLATPQLLSNSVYKILPW